MKHLRLFALLPLLLLVGCWNFGSNENDVVGEPASLYQAVTMDREAFENAVQIMPPQPVIKSGKIYINGNLLFVNDVNKGFHIYNYADAANPVAIGFLNIPGATDLAMRNTVLFINQATDLVTILYNAGNNTITVTKRNKNVFPQKVAPMGGWEEVSENEIIVDWEAI